MTQIKPSSCSSTFYRTRKNTGPRQCTPMSNRDRGHRHIPLSCALFFFFPEALPARGSQLPSSASSPSLFACSPETHSLMFKVLSWWGITTKQVCLPTYLPIFSRSLSSRSYSDHREPITNLHFLFAISFVKCIKRFTNVSFVRELFSLSERVCLSCIREVDLSSQKTLRYQTAVSDHVRHCQGLLMNFVNHS